MNSASDYISQLETCGNGEVARGIIVNALKAIYDSGNAIHGTFGGYSSPNSFATKEEVKTLFSGTKAPGYNMPYNLELNKQITTGTVTDVISGNNVPIADKAVTSKAIVEVIGNVDVLYKKVCGESKYNELVNTEYVKTENGNSKTVKLYPELKIVVGGRAWV